MKQVLFVAQCSNCKVKFNVENHMFLCPECGDPVVSIISGRDLALDEHGR